MERGSSQSNPAKVRSVGRVRIPSDWCPSAKGDRDTDTRRRKTCEGTGRRRRPHPGAHSLSHSLRRSRPCRHLDLGLPASRSARQCVCLGAPPVALGHGSPGKRVLMGDHPPEPSGSWVPFPQSWPEGPATHGRGTGNGAPRGRLSARRPCLSVGVSGPAFRPRRLPETTLPAASRALELDKGHRLLIAALSTALGLADEVGAPRCAPVAGVSLS